MKPTNDEVDAYVLGSLPATFQSLEQRAPDPDLWYRPIDGSLQRLKRRGLIAFERFGRVTTWRRVTTAETEQAPSL